MRTLDDLFSEEEIIRLLIRLRIQRAKGRHDKLFLSRQSSNADSPQESCELTLMFPPRRSWHRFRPRDRKSRASQDLNETALYRATIALRSSSSKQSWQITLESTVSRIKEKALSQNGHFFSTPFVGHQKKSGIEYRPIASFLSLDDKVIDSLVAKYFRELLDQSFENSSVAFRVQSGPDRRDRNAAIEEILSFRRANSKFAKYVSECDIRGFFDCVHHATALRCLKQCVRAVSRNSETTLEIDSRAIAAFKSYLDAYSFPRTVLRGATQTLRRETKNQNAYFKWPEDQLIRDGYYRAPKRARIGIPQGGAISCLIANVMLDFADKAVAKIDAENPGDFLYLRYCDDMIILSTSREKCSKAFESFCSTLGSLKLSFHEPIRVRAYGKSFYQKKSKHPYIWSGRHWFNHAPWVQFLGYQIRYDGLMRIRRSSLDKHKSKIISLTDTVLQVTDSRGSKIRASKIDYRYNKKLISHSFGRISLETYSAEPQPMSWSSGFSQLHNRPFLERQLRRLDCILERDRLRLARQLTRYNLIDKKPSRGGNENSETEKFWGLPFSHSGQFVNAGGEDLVRNPHKPTVCEERCLIPLVRWWKRRTDS